MKPITVTATIKNALLCIIHNPKVLVPFFVLFLISSLIAVVLFNSIINFIGTVAEPVLPFGTFGTIFRIIITLFAVVVIFVLMIPFFEAWTYAALGSAFKNQKVSLKKTAQKGASKYLGVLVISIIIAVVSGALSFIFSPFTSAAVVSSMEDYITGYGAERSLSLSTFYGAFLMYGVLFLITTIVLVLFYYMKPAFVIGDNPLSKSLNDGFTTAQKNFFPSCIVVLVLIILEGIPFFVFSGIVLMDLPNVELFVEEDITALYSYADTLLPWIAIALLFYFVLHTVFHAALSYAYMDSHDLL